MANSFVFALSNYYFWVVEAIVLLILDHPIKKLFGGEDMLYTT